MFNNQKNNQSPEESLSLENQFLLKKIKNDSRKMSREQLEKMTVEITRLYLLQKEVLPELMRLTF